MDKELIKKYNVPGPRYTSYPTVPYWDNDTEYDIQRWKENVIQTFSATNSKGGISLYIHLPYCESLCHYCGCNKKITRLHSVEEPYIERVLKEWSLYLSFLPEKPLIQELHLGGGTPTFFSAENLEKLIKGLLNDAIPTKTAEFSFEAHPNSTTQEKLTTLYNLGFKRLSLGVQDFNVEVQRVINRYQTFEEVQQVCDLARKIGYTSINFDLIYGLPKQTIASITDTIKQTIKLHPDRIAYYSYAHVPWVSKAQRLYSDEDLPANDFKRSMYETGKELLENAGYQEIGMDHFALPEEELSIAMTQDKMHRNFMGYTTAHTSLMIGLGVSSISDSWSAFGQNVKTLIEYERLIDQNQLPLFKGHFLHQEDEIIRKHILQLMCHFKTEWSNEESTIVDFESILSRLKEMESDGLCTIYPHKLEVTKKGRMFIRNICMAFDLRLYRNQPNTTIFSQTI